MKEFGESDGMQLIDKIKILLQEAQTIPMDWKTESLESATEKVRVHIQAAHPELSKLAIDVLAWTYSYENK